MLARSASCGLAKPEKRQAPEPGSPAHAAFACDGVEEGRHIFVCPLSVGAYTSKYARDSSLPKASAELPFFEYFAVELAGRPLGVASGGRGRIVAIPSQLRHWKTLRTWRCPAPSLPDGDPHQEICHSAKNIIC